MKKYTRAIFLLVIGISATGFALAQAGTPKILASDKYLISAKAGGVNFTEGAVNVIRADGKSGLLMKGDQIEIGDRVSTGSDGRVEVLLNPGRTCGWAVIRHLSLRALRSTISKSSLLAAAPCSKFSRRINFA